MVEDFIITKNCMSRKNKLTEFESYCRVWQEKLGITHIQIEYVRGCAKDALAETDYDPESMQATISLQRRLKKEIDLNRLALHEIAHLLLWPLDGDIEKELEVVGRLVNLLAKNY